LSSSFQSSERNVYHASVNGNKELINASYQPRQFYLFSTVQLGIAKRWKISPATSLTVEPYVKIPVSGIGMGNVPVSSAGIQFSIFPFRR